MRRILLAFRAFFLVLCKAEVAERVRQALEAEVPPAEKPKLEPAPPKPPPQAPARSETLTLLAALQREARFIDFVKEPLDGYNDAQIGAVARNIHRDCGSVLERMFALRPIVAQPEGAAVEVPDGADAGRYRLTGNVTDTPQKQGRLAHHGWEATQCELPTWTGSDQSARVVAPAEVELR